jgi:hypothetical protein
LLSGSALSPSSLRKQNINLFLSKSSSIANILRLSPLNGKTNLHTGAALYQYLPKLFDFLLQSQTSPAILAMSWNELELEKDNLSAEQMVGRWAVSMVDCSVAQLAES